MRIKALTNAEVAGKTGLDESTIRNVRTGKTRVYVTFQKICHALAVPMEEMLERHRQENSFSPSLLGGYRLPIFSLCLGSFTTIRPAVGEKTGDIECYQTNIWWDEGASCLAFREFSETGEDGQIYIPPSSAFLYMMTIRDGYVRTVVVSTMHNRDKEMYGAELSQIKIDVEGNNYVPVMRPIVFLKGDIDKDCPFFVQTDNDKYDVFQVLLKKASGYIKKVGF